MPTPEEQQRALAEQALQAWAGAPMLEQDPLAAQNDQLAAQAQQDLAMAAAGPPSPPVAPPAFVDPAAVSSMPEGPMSAPPEAMSPQQQLAANAFRTWSPPVAGDQSGGLAGWAPPAGPPPAAQHVTTVEPQNITASTRPNWMTAEQEQAANASMARNGAEFSAAANGFLEQVNDLTQKGATWRKEYSSLPDLGIGLMRAEAQRKAARPPSLMDQQGAMAGASRDAAEQARIDADISTDKQAGYVERLGEQQSETAQQMADAARAQQTDLEEAGRVATERRAVKEAVATDLAQQYKTLNNEAAAVEVRDRRSVGQRVTGALAIALGGLADQANLAAGLNIGMNVQTHNADRALAIVNESIDRDLAIQRANLTNKRDSAAAKYSELGIAQTAIKDVDAQESLAKAALMDKYALGLDAIKAQGMSEAATTTAAISAEQLRGNAAALRAQTLEQTAAKEEDRMWGLQVQREQERRAAAAARAKVAKPLTEKDRLANEQTALENEKLRKEIGGSDTVAPKGREIRDPALAKQATKEERSKFNDTQNVTQALESKINRLLKLRADHGVAVGVPQTTEYKEAQTLNREIMLGLKKKEELGTLDNQSERFLNEMTGDPNSWFINTPETQLEAIKRGARDDLESRAQGLGYSSALDQRDEYASKYGARER